MKNKIPTNFEILSKLADENNQNFHMYTDESILELNTGKKYGWIEFAVSPNEIYDVLLNKNRRFILLTFFDDDYQRIKKELENQ